MVFILDMDSLRKMQVLRNCVKNVNIEFIGPTSDAISRMGTKDVARETMEKQAFRLFRVLLELLQMNRKHCKLLKKLVFQLLLKQLQAVAVKGFVLQKIKKNLIKGIKITQKEAAAAFGNPGVYIEKYHRSFPSC